MKTRVRMARTDATSNGSIIPYRTDRPCLDGTSAASLRCPRLRERVPWAGAPTLVQGVAFSGNGLSGPAVFQ